MKQYILKLHPELIYEDGLIVVNAKSIKELKEILNKITYNDMYPNTKNNSSTDELFFNEHSPIFIQEKLDLEKCPNECWYILNVVNTSGNAGFIAGSYHAG